MILQENSFDFTEPVTVCLLTTDATDVPAIRLPVRPSESNGLRSPSRLMVDKITTVPKTKLGAWAGSRTRTC